MEPTRSLNAREVNPMTLAAELGVSASIVRRWLREQVDRGGESGPWLIDDDLAARVRERFRTTAAARATRPTICTVEGCERPLKGRGLCVMHYKPVGPPRVHGAPRWRGAPAFEEALPAGPRVHRGEHAGLPVGRAATVPNVPRGSGSSCGLQQCIDTGRTG